MTKLTVLVLPEAMAALDAAAERHGDTRTDTVNQALIAYEQVDRAPLLTLAVMVAYPLFVLAAGFGLGWWVS